MADGKWIAGLTRTTDLPEAARRVFSARLQVVAHWLPLAVREPYKDIENVHQLRVATRRAAAAFDLFGECLPHKLQRTGRKLLRKLRRAAGAARDWDVFQETLLEGRLLRGPTQRPALDFLLGYAGGRRAAAQVELRNVAAEKAERIEEVCRTIPDSVRAHPEFETVGELADDRLHARLTAFTNVAAELPTDYEALHQVRIHGKRLRYAMEVFADSFSPDFKEQLYPAIAEMQEMLGNCNDSKVIRERLQETASEFGSLHPAEWERLRPGIERLDRFHKRRMPLERKRFLAWWPKWRQLILNYPLKPTSS